jgi:hypothetical protein
MAERNPDTLPTPGDPSGPCPWCGRISNFTVTDVSGWLASGPSGGGGFKALYKLSVLRCQGCEQGTAVVSSGAHSREGQHWWPVPGMGTLDPEVNPAVASCYDEGMKCLAVGANRAAAVMFRSSLTLFVKDKGNERSKTERHLKTALNHMKTDGQLHASLWDWADHLNQLGNEGAHPEDYDDVTAEEAGSLGKFVRHLIRHEYEMPAQLLRDRGLI